MRNLEADGIIAYTWDPRLIRTIVDYGLPALIRGIEDPLSTAHPIRTDQAAVGRMAADYFLERGFQRFAYCGFIDVTWSEQRGAHFGRRVAEAGFGTYFYQPSNAGRLRTIDKERMIIAKWLQSLPSPIAVMACNDDRSRDIIAACRLAGVNVPREIAILGVDNDEFICELSYPQLSSIVLNTERAGYEAVGVLNRLMKGERIKRADAIVYVSPLHVVTRQSTDVMAIDDPDVAEAVHFIRMHSREPILVSEVAEAVGLSRRALEQRFRKRLGHSLHDEIKSSRVNQMAQMLIDTRLPISRIAVMLECPDGSNISRYFKKQKGMSPSEYRRKFART